MKLAIIVLTALVFAVPAQAEELSPWFGGENGEPFQVALDQTQAVATAETPLAVVENACELDDCPEQPKLAIEHTGSVAP